IDRHAVGDVLAVAAAVGNGGLAAAAKAAVQAAVAVQPGHRDAGGGDARHDDVAGRIDGHTCGVVVAQAAAEVERGLAAAAETGVEAAVAVQAGHGETAAGAG